MIAFSKHRSLWPSGCKDRSCVLGFVSCLDGHLRKSGNHESWGQLCGHLVTSLVPFGSERATDLPQKMHSMHFSHPTLDDNYCGFPAGGFQHSLLFKHTWDNYFELTTNAGILGQPARRNLKSSLCLWNFEQTSDVKS